MGTPILTRIDRWDGGIVNDPRDPNMNTARMVSNFDVLTNPKKLTPYRNSESGDSAPTTSQKQNFCIALRSGTTYKLYALGVVSGTGRAEVLMKDLTAGSTTTDLDDSGWDTPANNQSTTGATSFNLFVYYKKVGLIFGARAGTNIWAFDPSSSSAWADSHQALTYTNITQGIVHSKDDILYIPYDNKIAKNNNGSWTTAALTLPTHYVITSISEYGNFLAIGASHISGVGNSIVYLWDRDSSLTTISESVDWGEGSLMILAQLEGVLIGISQTSGLASFGSFPNSAIRFKDRIIFRALLKGGARKIKELIVSTSTQLPIPKQVIDNRLYFMLRGSINNDTREGVWSIGRNDLGEWVLIHERTPNNATATTSGVMKGFFIVGDYMFISYTDNGDFALSKTNDSVAYTTSIWEKRFVRDASNKYELNWLSVSTESLPSGTQVVVKYKKDDETSFSSAILTHSTVSTLFKNINSQGASLPKNYNELELRIESTGAEITTLEFQEELIKTPPYA